MSEKIVLLLAANPKKATPLRLDDELSEIRRSLAHAKIRHRFRLEVVMSARQNDVQRALLDHKPYVVHFSGHGTEDAEIVIVKDDGSAQYVGAEALVPFFEIFSDHVECVVLSSCFTQPLAEKIGQHVRYVVGIKNALQDASAIEYAAGFYDALFGDRSVEQAHKLGCNAITWPELPGHLTPVLYVAESAAKKVCGESTTEDFSQRFNQEVWPELSRLYARPAAARTLLSRVGFPRDRVPLFSVGNAVEFWVEVRDLLADGVVEGADLKSLLHVARIDFPGNKVLKQAVEG